MTEWSLCGEEDRVRLLGRSTSEFDPELRDSILKLVEEVKDEGDAAVVRALERHDGIAVDQSRLRLSADEIARGAGQVDPGLAAALRHAIRNIETFNRRVIEETRWEIEIEPGLVAGQRSTPIASAGLFVPSGKGSFPSVLAQIGTPARVAGVPETAVVVPPVAGGSGEVDPAVLFVAVELGLEAVYRANGPAGVAALAFGTESIPKVVKVVGPGSAPVQAAQIACQLFGCHTQMVMGPTESLVIADGDADPVLVAADLINEAEHGPDSASVLVTDSAGLIVEARRSVAEQLLELPETRREYAAGVLSKPGTAFLVESLEAAAEVANRYGPEHLMINASEPDAVAELIVHAGEVLIGESTPFTLGNYAAGGPAALPTNGFARVTGGVTAETFRKKVATAKATPEGLDGLAPDLVAIAEHEGFPAHAAAVRIREGGSQSRVYKNQAKEEDR